MRWLCRHGREILWLRCKFGYEVRIRLHRHVGRHAAEQFAACLAGRERYTAGVSAGTSSEDIIGRGASNAKFLSRDLATPSRPVAHIDDASTPSWRDFIDAIEAVHDQTSVHSQHAKSFGNFLDQIKRVHSD